MKETKPFLTVFTPAFNRAHTLHMNYEMLKKQRDKDFIWMIVDDGSTDNTKELVSGWISEGAIRILYHKQENKGKPSATNYSIKNSKSVLWVCIDSDDYISENAVAIIRRQYENARLNPKCACIIGNKYDMDTGNAVGVDGGTKYAIEFPKDIEYAYHWEIEYKYHIRADKVYFFFLDILKKYKYPIISDEKFIGESILFEQIGTDYQFYIIHQKLYFCKYLEDGLTASYLQLHIRNPKGYKMLKQQEMIYPKPLIEKFKSAIMYVAGCKLCHDKYIVYNSPKRIMAFLAYPFGLLAFQLKYLPLLKDTK